jgi:nucleoside-diphosphate-sugar epimerase
MRVFVAGATGVLGRQLLPLLAAHGHQVVGMARNASAEVPSSPNVELVTADALDPSAVAWMTLRPRSLIGFQAWQPYSMHRHLDICRDRSSDWRSADGVSLF